MVKCFTFWQVLFVCKDQDDGISHFSVINDPVQLLSRLINPVAVRAVDDENETLCSRVIMAPKRTDLVLTSNILKNNSSLKLLSLAKGDLARFHQHVARFGTIFSRFLRGQYLSQFLTLFSQFLMLDKFSLSQIVKYFTNYLISLPKGHIV